MQGVKKRYREINFVSSVKYVPKKTLENKLRSNGGRLFFSPAGSEVGGGSEEHVAHESEYYVEDGHGSRGVEGVFQRQKRLFQRPSCVICRVVALKLSQSQSLMSQFLENYQIKWQIDREELK